VAGWRVWLVAVALYVGFRLFYDTVRGTPTQPEIDTVLARAEAQGAGDLNGLAIVRHALSARRASAPALVATPRVPHKPQHRAVAAR